ncbi:MAG TPA: type VI secretion system tube protein TssD [Saprospiraceae bacterium]|nr:type VI secretion system tube protein TssD [Saprospiraceae bacterium]HPI06224.1 type VI secretion system tube protein TssD [Saprospiraceae bacterium]
MPITAIYLQPKDQPRQRLLNYKIDFDQHIDDRTGEPVGQPVLTKLSVVISRSSQDNEPFFVDWMLDPSKKVDLTIAFYDNTHLKRELKIDGAYLVSYLQELKQAGTIEETLEISPEKMQIDSIPFDRQDAM